MLILALESSAKAAGAALIRDGAVLAESWLNSGQTHSRTLLLLAEQLLASCGLTAEDVSACAVAEGPGSFTGVRSGVAAAKGFAWGRELPVYGVSTLEAMVRSAAFCDGVYCACMDARRQQVYQALFCVEDGMMRRLSEDGARPLSELEQVLNTLRGPVFLIGDGAKLVYDALVPRVSADLRLPPEHLRLQHGSGVGLVAWEHALAGEPGDAAALTPNYLRPSQAERTRAENEEFYLKTKNKKENEV